MKHLFCTILLLSVILIQVSGQVTSNKVVGKKNEALKDSLQSTAYPYVLPIWGAKVAEKGFELPYSAGVSLNYMTQKSALIMDNLQVGFNNGPMINLDEIVRFDESEAWAGALTVRPDVWVLPFLDVYALMGQANTSTSITAGVWLPDANNVWNEVTTFSTKAEFTAQTLGFGLTPTIGVGGGFMALDMNCAWTDVSSLDKPVFTFVFGPRFGKSFKFRKPQQSVSVWVGGFRVHFSSETNGSINLSEIMPPNELQSKVDNGIAKVGESQVAVDNWWNSLTPREQNNPVNEAKYNTANRVLDTAGNLFTSMDAALNDGESASIQYSLDKTLKDMWNFVIGSQYQYNKHWMIRAEYGFLGSRVQFMGGLQYRFGL